MKKQKPDYTELQCKNFLERGYNIVLTEFENGRPEGVRRPSKYYGMIHEVVTCPDARYFSTELYLWNLVSECEVYNGKPKRIDFAILYCDPTSTQKLTVNGWTLDLSRYNREQVMEFLRKQGVTIKSFDVKV